MAKSKKTSDAFDMAADIRKEVAAESVADACSTSVPAIYSLAKGDNPRRAKYDKKYEIHRLNFTVAIIDIDDERSLFLFHFRNLAIRDGAAGKLEMNVIVASFPAGSGKGSRLAL